MGRWTVDFVPTFTVARTLGYIPWKPPTCTEVWVQPSVAAGGVQLRSTPARQSTPFVGVTATLVGAAGTAGHGHSGYTRSLSQDRLEGPEPEEAETV